MNAPEPRPRHAWLPWNHRPEFRQRCRSAFGCVFALALGLSATLTARADVTVYSNLGSAPYATYGYATFGLYSDGYQYQRGMQFKASQTAMLSTVALALGEAYFPSGNSAQSGTARVQLMTDNHNAPGAVLESWTSGGISGSPGNATVQTFTSLLTPMLTAGSNYWIVCDAPNSYLGGAWCFADNDHTGNTLTMWANVSTGSTTFTTLTRGYQSQIIGNTIPSLSIARTGSNTVVLSWPSSAVGWVLEYTNSVTKPSNPWPQYLPPYSSTATNFFTIITNAPAAGNQFFRLQGP